MGSAVPCVLTLGLVQVYQPRLDRSAWHQPWAASLCLLRDCDPALQGALQASYARIRLPWGGIPIHPQGSACSGCSRKEGPLLSQFPSLQSWKHTRTWGCSGLRFAIAMTLAPISTEYPRLTALTLELNFFL